LKWISASQVQDLDYRVRRYIHFPTIPDYGQVADAEDLPKDPPSLLIKTFKEQNPNLPPDIDDDEILERYIPAPFPEKVRDALRGLSWIPENGELLDRSQHELLERIWDGLDIHHRRVRFCGQWTLLRILILDRFRKQGDGGGGSGRGYTSCALQRDEDWGT
jgi:hypothetical protein